MSDDLRRLRELERGLRFHGAFEEAVWVQQLADSIHVNSAQFMTIAILMRQNGFGITTDPDGEIVCGVLKSDSRYRRENNKGVKGEMPKLRRGRPGSRTKHKD